MIMRGLQRSYAQILKKKSNIIFHVVNRDHKQFQVYAEPLLNVWEEKGRYVRIKRKDNDPEKAGYYPGEVYGVIEDFTDADKEYSLLTLYIGTAYQRMKFENNKDPENAIEVHEYFFPKKVFIRYMKTLKDMVTQKTIFERLLSSSEIYDYMNIES